MSLYHSYLFARQSVRTMSVPFYPGISSILRGGNLMALQTRSAYCRFVFTLLAGVLAMGCGAAALAGGKVPGPFFDPHSSDKKGRADLKPIG